MSAAHGVVAGKHYCQGGFEQTEQDTFNQTGIAEYHTFTTNCCNILLLYLQAALKIVFPVPRHFRKVMPCVRRVIEQSDKRRNYGFI